MSEGKETKEIKMTPDQQAKAEKDFRKQQATQLADYKKRLRDGNDLKKLQVEELELNIRYYEAKRKWFDLREPMEKLEEEEQAFLAEQKAKQLEMQRLHKEAAEKRAAEAKEKADKEKDEKPKIIIPKQGEPRGK